MQYPLGIDASHWNGSLNTEKLKANGIQFAIVKAGEVWIKQPNKPAVKDVQHDRNIAELKRVGIICGNYYYFHPSAGASKQARHYAEIWFKNPPDLPPVIDIEDTDGYKPLDVQKQLFAFMDELRKKIDRPPIIYSRNGFIVNQIGDPVWAKDVLFWIASYNKKIGSLSPKIKANTVLWQFTDRMKLPGLPPLDGNYWLRSMEELQGLAKSAIDTPPVVPVPIAGKIGTVVASVLNVRDKPDFIGSKVIGHVFLFNEIIILSVKNKRWAEFLYEGSIAYCAMSGGNGTTYVQVKE